MPLAHAILAFLEFHPMSGYDLKKIFDASVTHFWSATQSHIYKELDELQVKEWVTVKLISQQDKPNRREYQLTELGRTELHRWLTTPLPLEKVRADWLIQIFFSTASSNEQIADLLQSRIAEIQLRQHAYRTEAQASLDEYGKKVGPERSRLLWQMTLDFGIDYYEFEQAWLEKKLQTIQDLPSSPSLKP
jgi:PadR family transcriptional regulator, regulatory protein AphA